MNTHQNFFSISDWWNYASATSDAARGAPLHEYLLDGRTDERGERDVAAETPSRDQGYGLIAAAVAQAASEAARAASLRASGNGWTSECFAGWNPKSV